MFSNRRKRIEMNKVNYYGNKIAYHLSPHQGVIPEMEENPLWALSGNNIYNTNSQNVAIGFSAPLTALDVSGQINTSQKYTINYINIAPPVGSIMAYTSDSSPDGWLLCDGTTYLIAQYRGLFNVIQHSFDEYGYEDLSFNVPNYCGAFLRGVGSNGNYVGPALNAPQAHATQTHSHAASSDVHETPHSHNTSDAYWCSQQAGNSHLLGSGAGEDTDNAVVTRNVTTSPTYTGISVTTTINNSTTYTNDNETRPYNYGVWWIIKY